MVRAPAAYKKQFLGPHEDLEWGGCAAECLLKEIPFPSLVEEYTSV